MKTIIIVAAFVLFIATTALTPSNVFRTARMRRNDSQPGGSTSDYNLAVYPVVHQSSIGCVGMRNLLAPHSFDRIASDASDGTYFQLNAPRLCREACYVASDDAALLLRV